MSIRKHVVRVYKVPEQMTATKERSFLRDNAEVYRDGAPSHCPRTAPVCGTGYRYDPPAALLSGRGDESAMVTLDWHRCVRRRRCGLRGVNRLFERYPTADGAVQSFHQRPASHSAAGIRNRSLDDRDSGHGSVAARCDGIQKVRLEQVLEQAMKS